jgi:hypothetical protein
MVQEVEREHAMAPAVRTHDGIVLAWPGRPASGKYACNVAGVGEAFDRGHQKPDHNPDAPRHQGRRIVDKGESDFRSKGLHFGSLRVK